MTTKTLYLLVSDGGDGSYSISYTLDPETIRLRQEAYDNDEYEHGDPGVDGDGFHYSTIQVPADATYASLGISEWSVLDAPETGDE
jgi:hypothetical protein